MALKLSLRPNERVIIGGAVLCNAGSHVAHVLVENEAAVLRGCDVLRSEDATTPGRRIYMVVQLMYVEPARFRDLQPQYWQLVEQTVDALPSTLSLLEQISMKILSGDFYRALKLAKRLIAYEDALLARAQENTESAEPKEVATPVCATA